MSFSGTTKAGTSLAGLTAAAKRAGIRVRAWGGPLDSVTQQRLPAIAFVDDNHFVVIRSYEQDGTVLLTDPAVGTYQSPAARLRERWSGHAVVMVPDSSTAPVAARWGRPDPNGRAKSLGGDHGAEE
jgi:ATP-binding cassette subfamily B protein